MVPVGAALHDRETVGEGVTRLDAVETSSDPRHAVHGARQDNAMPVDGAVFSQHIGDIEGDGVTFSPAKHRCGKRAVDCGGAGATSSEIHLLFANGEVKGVTAKGLWALLLKCGVECRWRKPDKGGTSGYALHKTAARQACARARIWVFCCHVYFLCGSKPQWLMPRTTWMMWISVGEELAARRAFKRRGVLTVKTILSGGYEAGTVV